VRPEELGQLKNYLIGNRTRYLPAYSIVPQPTTLPRAPIEVTSIKIIFLCPEQPRAVSKFGLKPL
jgi:hypothetical protein